MAQSQQQRRGSIGTVQPVETGADYKPIEALQNAEPVKTERRSRVKRLPQAEEDRYSIIVKYFTPAMLDNVKALPAGHERRVLVGDSETLSRLVPSVVRFLRNKAVNGVVVGFVPGSANQDGTGRGIVKVRRPNARAARREVVALSDAERALLKA